MIEIIGKTNIDFLGKRGIAYLFSLILVIGTVVIWIQRGDTLYDIDFKGGHEIVIKIPSGSGNTETIRTALNAQGMDDAIVQSFEIGSDEYSIRVGGTAADSKILRDKVNAMLTASFPGGELLQTEFIGPAAGQEMKYKAFLAIILSLIGIVIYVSVRFEFAFALGALIALIHDVVVATGFYLLAGHNINMLAVAAALTIVGYSVNDTIVIFDKVREEAFKRKDIDLVSLINECVNHMLSRTIITSGLTFLSVLALYLFGGGAISDLSLFLLVGIIAGSYSTIFIASPIVLSWENFRSKRTKQVTA